MAGWKNNNLKMYLLLKMVIFQPAMVFLREVLFLLFSLFHTVLSAELDNGLVSNYEAVRGFTILLQASLDG